MNYKKGYHSFKSINFNSQLVLTQLGLYFNGRNGQRAKRATGKPGNGLTG